jgi:hypothetical protein
MSCDVQRKQCVPGVVDMASGDFAQPDFSGGCMTFMQCGNPLPFCVNGQCVACSPDPGADGGASTTCMQIDATRPLCAPSGSCVECVGNVDCLAQHKSCQMGVCAPCVLNSDCASGYCAGGACGDPSTLVYVSKTCNPPGTGMFNNPYCKVQDGLNGFGGRVVVVEPGTYSENVSVQASMGSPFQVTAVAAGQVVLQPAAPGSPAVTVLDGQMDRQLTALTLDGFTITGVTGNLNPQTPAAVYLFNCRFHADQLLLKFNLQGGIYLQSSNFTVANTLVYKNGTSQNGSSPSPFGGINILSTVTTATIFNTTLSANTSADFATAGLGCGGSPLIVNTVVVGNTSQAGDLNAQNCKPAYSAFPGASTGGTGTNNQELKSCLASDLFVDPANDDYHPKKGGVVPCTLIDDGIDGFGGANAPTYDLDGKPRPAPAGGKFDIGAYEAQ